MEREKISYKIADFAVSIDNEISRLKAQVELFWEKEHRCFRMFGLADGMNILECGCGPGYLLEKLMQSFPNSNITGVEIDPLLAKKCKERLYPAGGDRIKVFEQSIMQMEFEDNCFDFVISRLVLEHLSDPLKAVKEVYRVLKPGGKCVFIDNDFDMHLKACPDIPELDELYDAYCRCRIAEGGNPRIGSELPGIIQESGFANVDLEIVNAHNKIVGDEVFLMSEGSGIPAKLVKDGYLSRDVFDKLAVKWHNALKQKHHVFFRQLFVAVGEKIHLHHGQHNTGFHQPVKSKEYLPVQAILNAGYSEGSGQFFTSYLQLQVAGLLETDPVSIDADRPLIALGINSLISVELANTIFANFNISISAIDILEAQSIHLLAARLDTEIERQKEITLPMNETQGAENTGESFLNRTGGSSQNETEWEEGYI